MGIPFYFHKVVRQFNPLSPCPLRLTNIDYFCLDFNSVIHNCANEVVSALNTKDDVNYTTIINSIITQLVSLINIVPAKVILVAIDGLCPMAKIVQQRKRRFMNAPDPSSPKKWDSNIVTPGTQFMKDLDEALTTFCDKNKGVFNIIFSPSSEEGEGEQKIFDFLRRQQCSNETKKECVIYGLDADLIMLSLIEKRHNITLLRERPFFNNFIPRKTESAYILFNIAKLRQSINNLYDITDEEYVVLCFLLGNDFLPPLSYLTIKDKGIETVIDAYDRSIPLILDDGLNMLSLYTLFSNLNRCDSERAIICESYYPKYFEKGVDIQNIVYHYLHGIHWCYNYYFIRQNFSYMWYYKHNYSPKIDSITKYCKSYIYTCTTNKTNKTNTKNATNKTNADAYSESLFNKMRINSDIQLFLVLPPQCLKYIQDSYIRNLATDVSMGFAHCFPIQFKKESYLKSKEWQYIPLIPKIDLVKLDQNITCRPI